MAQKKETTVGLTTKACEVLARVGQLLGRGDTVSAALVAFDKLDPGQQMEALREAKGIEAPEPAMAEV